MGSANKPVTNEADEKTDKSDQSSKEKTEITFQVEPDLSVKIITKIDPEIKETLVVNGYLNDDAAITDQSVQLALILIANETAEAVIERINLGYEDERSD